ncbi:MAG: N-acetylmuramoyl-L-alanine amidase [Flavobacteriales bacterium]|nr:N-acetylmuramoyl-L-alanine amidase [Flavobacteriales bacterium]
MYNIRFIFIFLFLVPNISFAQNKTETYILKYRNLAVSEMKIYGIPASITLAQGILESANGESKLASEGNNHFGIKCHDEWKGDKIYHDDDEKNECFRKYNSVKESFRDHSLFLREKKRYEFLFNTSDYKKWARGLSKAGYATNPKYSKLLINIIKKYELYNYDNSLSKRTYYLSTNVGFPYICGLGVYYFDKDFMMFLDLNSSIIINRFNLGFSYRIFKDFYIGLNTGSNFSEQNNKFDFDMKIGTELSYKYKTKSNIIKIGLDYSKLNEFGIREQYIYIPYLSKVFLIK